MDERKEMDERTESLFGWLVQQYQAGQKGFEHQKAVVELKELKIVAADDELSRTLDVLNRHQGLGAYQGRIVDNRYGNGVFYTHDDIQLAWRDYQGWKRSRECPKCHIKLKPITHLYCERCDYPHWQKAEE